MLNRISRAARIAAALAAVPLTASASLVSYEAFDYPSGTNGLAGQSGGIGFTGDWTLSPGQTNGPDVFADSLSYTDANGVTLPVSGGRVVADSTDLNAGAVGETVTAFRVVSGGISGITGSTLYLSFIGQQTQGTERFANLALYGTALQEIIAIGHGTSSGGQRWGAYVEGIGGRGDYSTTPSSTLSFLVLRIDLNINETGNDRFRLYVNPTLGIEPLTADVDVTDFDLFSSFAAIEQIRIGAGGSTEFLPASQIQVDEIRMADSFAIVAPVPEPSTSALLAVSLVALSLRRPLRRSHSGAQACSAAPTLAMREG